LQVTFSIRIVADCVELSCQITRKLKRATTLDFTTVSAIILIHCVCPAWASGIEDTKFFQRVKVPYERVGEAR
jgi:hypothetical protein